MPGIVGFHSRNPAQNRLDQVGAMISSLMHEPFYRSGEYVAPDLGMYAGWVALSGSFAENGVSFNETQEIALLVSGECYVDDHVGAELRQRGHDVGPSRVNWLVHLYEEQGDHFFRSLNGVFSGLLMDRRRHCAFLFNDRYGLDRVHIHEHENEVYFASEAKALLRIIPESKSFDAEGLADFLTFGSTIANRTLFRGVQLLPGGSVWKFAGGKVTKSRYFHLEEWEHQAVLTADEFEEQFEETFERVLPRYCQPSSDIGISLTAGLDTRMIIACLREAAGKPVCYTYDGPTGKTLDTRLASLIAHVSGLEHHVLRVGGDFFSDFRAWVDRTVYATDGCFGVSGAHEIYLTKKARELAPIRLTGVFGSEVFRGASTFKPLRLDWQLLSQDGRRAIAAREAEFGCSTEHPVTFAAFREIPWNLFGSFAACRSQITFRTPYLDNDLVSLSFRAPDSLRKSAGPALRLVRRNASALSAIPTDMGIGGRAGFRAMRRLFSKVTFKLDYLSNEGLPHWASAIDPAIDRMRAKKFIFGHHKFLRYGSWFRKELAEYVQEGLSGAGAISSPLLSREFISGAARRHINSRANYLREINAVLTLEAVNRLLLKKNE